MINNLNQIFVPALRERGFKGSIPHFRRNFDDRIELLSIMFDKNGGAFLLEISTVFLNQSFTNLILKDETELLKINTFSTNYRYRIKRDNKNIWFYYWDLYKIKNLFLGKPIHIQVNPDRPIEEYFPEKLIEKNRIKKIFSVDQYICKELAEEAVTYIDQAEDWWFSFNLNNSQICLVTSK